MSDEQGIRSRILAALADVWTDLVRFDAAERAERIARYARDELGSTTKQVGTLTQLLHGITIWVNALEDRRQGHGPQSVAPAAAARHLNGAAR